MNHLTSRYRRLLAYDVALRRALDEVLGLTSAFVAAMDAGVEGAAGDLDQGDRADPVSEPAALADLLAEATDAIAPASPPAGDTEAVFPAADLAYTLVDSAAAAMVPKDLCERLLGGTPAPADLPGYLAAWLESAQPSPLDAALIVYAASSHIGLPELGLAGRRRIAEALDKFRRHYRIPGDGLLANLSEAAAVWSPARLWLASAVAREDRVARVRELPDRLRERAARSETARREAEQRSRALAAEADDLAGRLERLRRENDTLRATAERRQQELDALRAEAVRAADLAAQLTRVRAREADTRTRLEELERAVDADGGSAATPEADAAEDADTEQGPDLSTVYLVVLHSNDKDNTPAEVRHELLARGVGHVEVQRIDESRVPASFPRGAIVAIDASFMSHPVAEKAYGNAMAAAAPVFRFTKLGPARLHRRLVRFLREQQDTSPEETPAGHPPEPH